MAVLLEIWTPIEVLPEMTLASPGRRPADRVARGGVDRDPDAVSQRVSPELSVPMKLPRTGLPDELPAISIPLPAFPEMMFRSPAAVPPIVLPPGPAPRPHRRSAGRSSPWHRSR